MIEKKREIFIKLQNIAQVVSLLEEIKELEEKTKQSFRTYESLNTQENRIYENWSTYLEDIEQKLDHITL
ncbi:MAG: hypothetical protein VXZ40_04060 [Nanoarchaeota archaeon]|nr:hypothetical protein [Nanoarchaeota archaeon]